MLTFLRYLSFRFIGGRMSWDEWQHVKYLGREMLEHTNERTVSQYNQYVLYLEAKGAFPWRKSLRS